MCKSISKNENVSNAYLLAEYIFCNRIGGYSRKTPQLWISQISQAIGRQFRLILGLVWYGKGVISQEQFNFYP